MVHKAFPLGKVDFAKQKTDEVVQTLGIKYRKAIVGVEVFAMRIYPLTSPDKRACRSP